jgi:hypothetical protein
VRIWPWRTEAADATGIDPDQISFTVTVRIARVRTADQDQARRSVIIDILAEHRGPPRPPV